MSLTRQSCARSAVHKYQAGRVRMCTRPFSCGDRESQHQLISALIQTFARCLRGWRHSEYHRSSGFTEASAPAGTGSTIRALASDAPRLTACGGLQRLSRRRHRLAMREMVGSSAQSDPTLGSESRVVSFIFVPVVASSRGCKRETVPPNHSLDTSTVKRRSLREGRIRRSRSGCNRCVPWAGSLSL